MTSLGSDFTGCSVLIYDGAGNQLGSSTAVSYSRSSLRLELEKIPPSLGIGSVCRLLILTSPSPCEFQGRVNKDGSKKVIAMYFGQEKENRGSTRYKVNYKAMIENMVFNGRAYTLHTPVEVDIINISQSGVRFNTPPVKS